jgi:hypothetical protein
MSSTHLGRTMSGQAPHSVTGAGLRRPVASTGLLVVDDCLAKRPLGMQILLLSGHRSPIPNTRAMLPTHCFCLTSPQASTAENALFGVAVMDKDVIFGTGGLHAWQAAHPDAPFEACEGRFSFVVRETRTDPATRLSREVLRIGTDLTGQDTLFVYHDAAFWAVSNSFLLLVERVAEVRKLQIYEPTAIAFHLNGGRHLGEQLFSPKTLVEGIESLPATTELVIDLASGTVSRHDRPLHSVFGLNGRSYEEAVIDAVARATGTLLAMADHSPGLQCRLSGGYDSRVVLSLTLAALADRPDLLERMAIQSDVARPDDLAVATEVCAVYRLPLNVSRPALPEFSRSDGAELLRAWELSCRGVYLPIYPVPTLQHRPGMPLRLTGDTATTWDFYNGAGQLNGDARKVEAGLRTMLRNRPHMETIVADFLSGFDRVGLDWDAPGAMALHYNLFRSRAHCGRAWYRDLGGSQLHAPLCTTAIAGLDLHVSALGQDPRTVYRDIFHLTDRRFMALPFMAGKGFPADLVAASPFLGHKPVTPWPMTTWGRRDACTLPASKSGMRNAEEPTVENVRDALHARVAQVDRAAYASLFTADDYARVDEELAKRGSLSHGYRKSAHLMSLDAVARIIS